MKEFGYEILYKIQIKKSECFRISKILKTSSIGIF